LALIAACFTFGNAPAGPATAGRVATGKAAPALWNSVKLALRLVIGTFDGWYSAIYFSEEVRDPGKDLPRSMVGGIAVVIAVYVLVNAALLHVLPVSRLAGSTLPAADAAEVLFGRGSGKLVTILCLVSLPATFNSALLCATRISFAMSRDNLFWVNASSVNRRGTPELAMALSAAAGVLLAVSGTFEQLLTMVGVWNYATFSAALASVLRLRRREPGLERPFTVRPYPGLTLLALGGGCALLVGAATGDPKSTLQALGLAAAGYPVYRLSRRFAARLAPLRRTPPGRTG
jgi:APA family basic amino acid/polyamine antiporter